MPGMLGIPHPYLTAHLPGVGGEIKRSLEDFIVEEVPLYYPSGKGEHTYFEIEKTDLSTLEALDRLARALDVSVESFGYAGLKDRKGITRQMVSLAHCPPERVEALELPQIRVLWAKLHSNKLRVGHLRGNRFRIWVRGLADPEASRVEAVVGLLLSLGIPNYYGPQRFGNRGDAHRIGRALLTGNDQEAVERILGRPSSDENNPQVVRARECFMEGDYRGALLSFPGTYREERRLLGYLTQPGANFAGARRRLGNTSKKLYFTAYQAYLFNLVVAERLRRRPLCLSALLEGDLAFLHRNGAVFLVTDAAHEQPRADAFEVSPSGPIFGKEMPHPQGEPLEMEHQILQREGLPLTQFHQLMPKLHLEGGRRPLRIAVEHLSWRLEGRDLYLEFTLSKGSYATTFIREITKNDAVPQGFYEDYEEEKHGLWRPQSIRPARAPADSGDGE